MVFENFFEDPALILLITGTIFGFLSFVVSYKTYKKISQKSLACTNRLKLENNKILLQVKLRNKGSTIGVDAVHLNLITWNQSPKLKVNFILKIRRVLRSLLIKEESISYPSELSMVYSSKELPSTLSEEEPFQCDIDLDKVMQVIIERRESYGSKLLLFFCIFRLKIHVITGSGLWTFTVDPEATHYLWKSYKNSPDLIS